MGARTTFQENLDRLVYLTFEPWAQVRETVWNSFTFVGIDVIVKKDMTLGLIEVNSKMKIGLDYLKDHVELKPNELSPLMKGELEAKGKAFTGAFHVITKTKHASRFYRHLNSASLRRQIPDLHPFKPSLVMRLPGGR